MSEQKVLESVKSEIEQLHICLKSAKKEEIMEMLSISRGSLSKIQKSIAELKNDFSTNLDSKYIDEMIVLTTIKSYLVKLEKDINRKLQNFSSTV
jgi:uncharacterized protein (DUF305 family)